MRKGNTVIYVRWTVTGGIREAICCVLGLKKRVKPKQQHTKPSTSMHTHEDSKDIKNNGWQRRGPLNTQAQNAIPLTRVPHPLGCGNQGIRAAGPDNYRAAGPGDCLAPQAPDF